MPIYDVYGEISPGSELILDITSQKFAPLVMDLLPHGPAWDREGAILRAVASAEAVELSRVDVRARALVRELDPAQTFEMLTDWEKCYGLPECSSPYTLEGRRAALKAKLLTQTGHDHSPQWWAGLVANLGYDLHWVDQGPGCMTCDDDCIDPLATENFDFYLGVDPGPDDALLECFVNKNALLISFPVVHYMWQTVTVPGATDFVGVACNVKGYTVAVANVGYIYVTDDLLAFNPFGPLADVFFYGVCAVDGRFLAIATELGGGVVLYSDDNGGSWFTGGAIPPIDQLWGITRGPYADLVAVTVGENGRIFRTANAGLTWIEMASPVVDPVQLIGVTSARDVMVAVGSDDISGIVRSLDNGLTWEYVANPGMTQFLFNVAGYLDTIIAVGTAGEIWRSTDKALTWTLIPSGVTETLWGVTGSPSGRWTACGNNGTILQSIDDGLTWEIQISPVTDNLKAACAHRPDGRAVLVGVNSTVVLE